VLLLSLHSYRIVPLLGLEKLSLDAFGVSLDTRAGPNLVLRGALAPDWLQQVVTSKEEGQVPLQDSQKARLRILGWTFIEDDAHAILPQDRSIRCTDGSVTAILRGPLDDGDRSMGVSCVLRSSGKTRLPRSAATVVWVRTMRGGMGQVFGT